jgi:carboxylesterase type B
MALIADVLFDCNAQVVAWSYAAHSNNAFRYIFAVPPAKHADDLSYSFYSNGDNPSDTVVVNTSVASVLQQIITSLAMSGIPKSAPHKLLTTYGEKQNILVVNKTVVYQRVGDPWQNKRCAFWQQVDYVQG